MLRAIGFVLVACAAATTVAAAQSTAADAPITFEREIRPILKAHCFDCHGADEELEGGLDLRQRRLIVKGGDSGAAIEPDTPEESFLLQRIRDGEMPPGDKKVPPRDIDTLERWIAAGAPTAREEPNTIGKGVGITPEERAFWSFQPIERPNVPRSGAADRVRTPIDAFLLARMKEHGLAFSTDADRPTLIRRAYFDLIGLPPSLDEVQMFLVDDSPNAYERLIDRLLASPHYGERWGRHWLDVAGYSDSEGYTNTDAARPWAYKYRDYLIQSLNDDKPFDHFIQEQLAGDETVQGPHTNLSPNQIEKLTATGFLRMAADGTGSGANDDEARNQTIADTIKIVSTSLLGLSVGCAQCHDHRYDPIPQSDYYQLRAIFEPALDWKNWRTPQQRLISLYTDDDRAKAAAVEAEAGKIAAEKSTTQQKYINEALEKELAKFDDGLRDKLRTAYKTPDDQRSAEQKQLLKAHPSANINGGNLYQYNQAAADDLKKYDERIKNTRAKKPVEQFIRALTEIPGQVPVTHVFHRGDFKQLKAAVSPGGLTIAAQPGDRFTATANDASRTTTGRRLAYAQWLTNGEHPLLARVIVNRVWMHHFGRGIVGTPADFGVLGDRPTHSKLLDWLANEFMARGWSLKKLHKLIMTSTVCRQSSVADPANSLASAGNDRDPANRWYWRKPVQRLDAELVRDRMLATNGVLGDQLFGAPVAIKPDSAGQVIVEGDPSRRSIYVTVKRTQPVAMLKAFDAPVMETNCDRRTSSTAATQALMLMNSDFILRQARTLADRVAREADLAKTIRASVADRPLQSPTLPAELKDLPRQVAYAWQLAYCRPATHEEIRESLEFLTEQIEFLRDSGGDEQADAVRQAMTDLCQALLTSNEFLYVD